MVSVIIPVLNEESCIPAALLRLREAEGDFEVIVSDGASTDASCACVRSCVPGFGRSLRLISAPRNRAVQMNRGAENARGDVFLFLHADARIPKQAFCCMEDALKKPDVIGGNFSVIYGGDLRWSRFFTWANRSRRRLGIYYGDSGLFIRRRVFEALGGFKPMPLMEDYEFVRRMERYGTTVCLPCAITVSDRRWRIRGSGKTLLAWIAVQALYSCGAPAKWLARWYPPVREE